MKCHWCLMTALPEHPADLVHRHLAPQPTERDAGHPRYLSLDRALALAARIADRKHWRHRP